MLGHIYISSCIQNELIRVYVYANELRHLFVLQSVPSMSMLPCIHLIPYFVVVYGWYITKDLFDIQLSVCSV